VKSVVDFEHHSDCIFLVMVTNTVSHYPPQISLPFFFWDLVHTKTCRTLSVNSYLHDLFFIYSLFCHLQIHFLISFSMWSSFTILMAIDYIVCANENYYTVVQFLIIMRNWTTVIVFSWKYWSSYVYYSSSQWNSDLYLQYSITNSHKILTHAWER